MTTRNILALSLAAAVLSSGFAISAQAAKKHTHPMPHHAMHSMHAKPGAPMDADHSADALNAQSLSRSQNGQ